jgi:adenylate cyclase
MTSLNEYPVQRERERRFLVAEPSIVRGASWTLITQGYFFAQDGYAIRVRYRETPTDRKGGLRFLDARLTAKGPRFGDERDEYEADMDPILAYEFVKRCTRVIRKRRYQLPVGNTWEIDEFLDDNEGLWIAELEGKDIREVKMPDWAFREITSETKFNNDELAYRPISKWDSDDWKPKSPWDWN